MQTLFKRMHSPTKYRPFEAAVVPCSPMELTSYINILKSMNYSPEFNLLLELRLGTPSMHYAMGATAKMFNGFVGFLCMKEEKKGKKTAKN